MTSTINDLARSLFSSDNFEALARNLDGIALVLLIVLLIEVELIRAFGGPQVRARIKPLSVAIAPLLLVFVLVVVVRSMDLR